MKFSALMAVASAVHLNSLSQMKAKEGPEQELEGIF